MKLRTFQVGAGLPLWRLTLGLVLLFLPFSLLSAGILSLVFTFSGESGLAVFPTILAGLLSAGIVHELGHWAFSQPGARVRSFLTTPGLSSVRIQLDPDLEAGSPRWFLRMLGGALANGLVLVLLWGIVQLDPALRNRFWFEALFFLHLLTGAANLVPLRTGFTGPTDGWLILAGLRERRRSAPDPAGSPTSL